MFGVAGIRPVRVNHWFVYKLGFMNAYMMDESTVYM
jgi:hypothetical protein